MAVWCDAELDLAQIVDLIIGVGDVVYICFGVSDGDDLHAGCLGCFNTVRRVFKDQALLGAKTKLTACGLIRLGMWLAIDDIIGGDKDLWDGQFDMIESMAGEFAAAG